MINRNLVLAIARDDSEQVHSLGIELVAIARARAETLEEIAVHVLDALADRGSVQRLLDLVELLGGIHDADDVHPLAVAK